MKPGWSNRKLIDVATLQRGFDLPSQDRIAGAFPLVSSSGIIDTHATKAVTAPGVVTGRSGSIGNVFYIEDDFWPLNTTLYVKDFHGNDPRFVYHLLMHFDLRQFASGTGVPTLNRNSVHEEMVMVPPLPEQQRIVAILDEAFAAIATAKANAEKNLQNARAILGAELEIVFDHPKAHWVTRQFNELCTIKHGFAFLGEYFVSAGEFVVLTPGNFYESGGYRDRGPKQKFYSGDIPTEFVLQEGDLLVAMTEQAAGLLGSPILVPESNRFLHNQRLGLVVGLPGVPFVNRFFFFALNSARIRREIHLSASGVKVRHTSPSKIGEVQVSYPESKTEQQSAANRLEDLSAEVEKLSAVYQSKLAALDELKQSLLHRAFNGDL